MKKTGIKLNVVASNYSSIPRFYRQQSIGMKPSYIASNGKVHVYYKGKFRLVNNMGSGKVSIYDETLKTAYENKLRKAKGR